MENIEKNNQFRAKKSMGQNFLRSTGVVFRMIEKAEVKEENIVLEIGPGKGILTEALLSKGAVVYAIEKDDELFILLQEKFTKEIADKKLFLIHSDILNLSAKEIFSDYKPRLPSPEAGLGNGGQVKTINYKLISNIPYNITGEIMRKFLEEESQPSLIAFLVQKEVAERVTVKDGKESILSISVKAYGEPSYAFTVKRELFSPAPNVDSAVFIIKNISKKVFKENNIIEEKFFETVKKGFAHKRKKLSNNIVETKTIPELFIYKDKRPENLNLSDWINITKKIT